jgi:pectate disaccharide-lyase
MVATIFAAGIPASPVNLRVLGPKEYFVSPSGSVANDGSETSPWTTVPYALSQAGAGSIITMLDGNYAAIQLESNWSGSITRPTVIRAKNKWQAVVTNAPGHGIVEGDPPPAGIPVSWIIDGIKVQYAAQTGIKLTRNSIVRNCWAVSNYQVGIAFASSTSGGGVVEYCLSESNGTNGFNHGLYISGPNSVIRNNVVRNNWGYQIQYYTGSSLSQNNTHIYGNLSYGGTNVSDVVIYGAEDDGSPTTATTNYFYGNTVLGGVNISWGTWCFTNNIVLRSPVTGLAWNPAGSRAPTIRMGYNLSDTTTTPTGTGDVVASPQGFSSTNLARYWLTSSSAARGVALSTVHGDTDFFGDPLLSSPDIGAFQWFDRLERDTRNLSTSGADFWARGTW